MTDWSKLKVTDLKDELKARGIPLTGLKLKQQYVDKLEEHDAENAAKAENDTKYDETTGSKEELESQPNGEKGEPHDEAVHPSNNTEQKDPQPAEVKDEAPKESQKEETQVEAIAESSVLQAVTEEQPQQEPAPPEEAPPVPDPDSIGEQVDATQPGTSKVSGFSGQPDVSTDEQAGEPAPPLVAGISPSQKPAEQESPAPSNQPPSNQPLLESAQTSDVADEERKRKKRSATPVPSEEEIARKKARLSMDEETLTEEQASALKEMKSATETAKEIRGEAVNGAPADVIVEQPGDDMILTTEPTQQLRDTRVEESRAEENTPQAAPRRSRSPSEERDVPPAIHPATSSLYIRNFKRPLHIPSLRTHIASVAKSRSSPNESDPITLFYLDSIRTHAFVSFTSVAAASRVRSAMHDTRYPNESMREPLFVDFVPDDTVQSWIDQETGGGFGGRGGSGRRYEVVYEERGDGVEAIFQIVDANKPQPPLQPSRSSRMSIPNDRPGPELLPPGVHPDRAAFVPHVNDGDRGRDRDRDRMRQPPTGPKNSESTAKGFKALDELFQSTTTKPKLYYKPVPESVAAERLDMFRDLRVGYAEMGRSGDEGMKRYTFELYKGREEWVDKGPEFGFGRRGQDRLAGGRPRGGYRGRGGDSWRGGMTR